MKIFVIVPAYNESSRISETLQQLKKYDEYSVVAVDDGSTDNTYSIASSITTTLRHVINRGMGAALVTGTNYALRNGADIIVHFDADGQHQASEINTVIQPILDDSADIVLGSRYLKKNILPFSKKYFIHMPAIVFQNIFTGIYLTDVHNGFRAMNRVAALKLNMRQDRMAYSSEIISEIKRHHLRYKEVPVTISYREYGQGIGGGMRIIKDLIIKKIIK